MFFMPCPGNKRLLRQKHTVFSQEQPFPQKTQMAEQNLWITLWDNSGQTFNFQQL